jgi:hypothetical protein
MINMSNNKFSDTLWSYWYNDQMNTLELSGLPPRLVPSKLQNFIDSIYAVVCSDIHYTAMQQSSFYDQIK